MSWGMLAGAAISLGSSLFSGLTSMQAQQQTWAMQEALRKAQNLRIARAAAQATGGVVDNKIRAYGASQSISRAIQQEGMQKTGTAEVAAGAAGVTGNSVDRVFSSIERQQAGAELKRQTELGNQLSAYDAQMQNIWATANLQTDPYQMPKPSTAGPLINMGMNMASTLFGAEASFNKTTGTTGQFFNLGNMFTKGGLFGWTENKTGKSSSQSMPVDQTGFEPW